MAGSAVFVHGAGSGPEVFEGWELEGMGAVAVDLHAGLDVSRASMGDYARAVVAALDTAPPPHALVGWSMGGLVAMLAALERPPAALVLLEASAPAEVQGVDPAVEPRPGAFDPEEAYGAFPAGMRPRPESAYARAERKRGISVPALPARTLVVYGRDFPEERGRRLAARYGAATAEFPELGHWGLVRDPGPRRAVARFLLSGQMSPGSPG